MVDVLIENEDKQAMQEKVLSEFHLHIVWFK